VTATGPDELAGGTDRDPVRFPVWLRVVGVVLVVLVGWFVLARTGDRDEAPPAARPGPTGATAVAPTDPVTATGYPPIEGPLRLAGDMCLDTGPRSMTVQFQVENAGQAEVTVLSVSAHLPIGGLVPTGGEAPAGTYCGTDVDPATGTVLLPGDRLPVSLGFDLPPECPAPYPVQADFALIETGSDPTTQRLHLLADLGGYDFRSCHDE
jgi:hypothetical protein